MNTEKMMSEISLVNDEGIGRITIIGSTNVSSLNPSLDITVLKVGEVFHES